MSEAQPPPIEGEDAFYDSDEGELSGYETDQSEQDFDSNEAIVDDPSAEPANLQSYTIDHESGDYSFTPDKFIRRVSSEDFDGIQALHMIQQRLTIDYGRPASGSEPATDRDEYFPQFNLDMIVIIGSPLHAITSTSDCLPFSNIKFSFKSWHSSYSSKHAASSLPFKLDQRTFRLGTASSRETWFIVMHPVDVELIELPSRGVPKKPKTHVATGMLRHHAEALCEFIKTVFTHPDLIGQCIEASWQLGGPDERTINLSNWLVFQVAFVNQWPDFLLAYGHDDYWTNHQPAFHAYDHGANIEIPANEYVMTLPQETRIRDEHEEIPEDESTVFMSQPPIATQPSPARAPDQSASPTRSLTPVSQALPDPGSGAQRVPGSHTADEPAPQSPHDPPAPVESNSPFTGHLGTLRDSLERQFNLAHVDQVSYALAADIHCKREAASGDSHGDGPTACLLANFKTLGTQFSAKRQYVTYPMAFHPSYGNFTARRPPAFLSPLCAIMTGNSSLQNEGIDVLNFEYFQGYSNIKRSIRSRHSELLAARGTSTAALTLSGEDLASSPSHVRTRHERLLRSVRGENTPGSPDDSTPFAREGLRVKATMDADNVAFRMEQVITVKTSRLIPRNRNFSVVLNPIFQLMRFYLKHPETYSTILYKFDPAIFPGILVAYARLFSLALGEMEKRYRTAGVKGLSLAMCEGVAALDRLGSVCFTGDWRVLPGVVMKPLKSLESLRLGAWPFISPAILNIREGSGFIDLPNWPTDDDDKPILLHEAALRYQYGPATAARRCARIWFSDMCRTPLRTSVDAAKLIKIIIVKLWIPENMAFLARQLKRGKGFRANAESGPDGPMPSPSRTLDIWMGVDEPFSQPQLDTLFGTRAHPDPPFEAVINTKSRDDLAADIYAACMANEPNAGNKLAPIRCTWFYHIRAILRSTSATELSRTQWVTVIATSILEAGVEWVLGAVKGKLTTSTVLRLNGDVRPTRLVGGQMGSVKREAIEAEFQMAVASHKKVKKVKKSVRTNISFGCDVPFTRMPDLLRHGFDELQRLSFNRDKAVCNHYALAAMTLNDFIGDPLCDLMLMQVLTIASSTESLIVKSAESGFVVSPVTKDAAMSAAVLAMRMMWFAKPTSFVWKGDTDVMLSVPSMTKKLEQWKVNNRTVCQLGWVSHSGKRPTPKYSECRFAGTEALEHRCAKLMGLMKTPSLFIASVFNSNDPAWLDRCHTIIREIEE